MEDQLQQFDQLNQQNNLAINQNIQDNDGQTLASTTKYTVIVRIRPNFTQQKSVFKVHKQNFIKEYKQKSIITYGFDKVFNEEHTNKDIYNKNIRKILQNYKKGINTTIMAYGQSGSGKTYTLFNKQEGLFYYICENLLQYTKQQNQILQCSCIQLYNEKLNNLLTGKQLQLIQKNKKNIIKQLSFYKIIQYQHIQKLIKIIQYYRKIGSSYVHSKSSRSHLILTIIINKIKFNILDLCGNQLLTYQFNQKQRTQTNFINLSLFNLNVLISNISHNRLQYVSFRNSILTRILKQSFIGKLTQIFLICNISPQSSHQTFSSRTLKFGQLAIQIDVKTNTNDIVNLSQKKRQSKVCKNIIDVYPKVNRITAQPLKWQTNKINILGISCKVYQSPPKQTNKTIIFLHAYGSQCDGQDWNIFRNYLNENTQLNMHSIDFPGFGQSEGKKFTSRSQHFQKKNQPIEFFKSYFQTYHQNNQVILIGYDLGGSIALRMAMHPEFYQNVKAIIVFHPTWTDNIQALKSINIPVLIIWVPVENFHLLSAGNNMAKIIKGSVMYKFNIGPYTLSKASGYYNMYAEQISSIMCQFIEKQYQQSKQQCFRGQIIEQQIVQQKDIQKQQLNRIYKSYEQIKKLWNQKEINKVYNAIILSNNDKPAFIKLCYDLPCIDPKTINWDIALKWKLFNPNLKYNPTFSPKQLTPILDYSNMPLFVPYQTVHVQTTINMSMITTNEYLTYTPKGELGISYKAYISPNQQNKTIIETNKIKVHIKTTQNTYKQLSLPLNQVIHLNTPTIFKYNLGKYIFEDNTYCNYNSIYVKLILIQCILSIQRLISTYLNKENKQQYLQFQKQSTQIIYSSMNLKHLVHQGIDPTRYTGQDIGRLAHYGQGNCHHLASTLAALLYPFGRLFGWSVIFRGGSYLSCNRELNQLNQPLALWNGKPNTKVQDHTWLQIVYKPSYQIYVFDPSFNLCNKPLDSIYSFEGKMHISGKLPNFACKPNIPTKLYGQRQYNTKIEQQNSIAQQN